MNDAATQIPKLAAWALAVLLAGAGGARAELRPSHLRGEARAVSLARANGGAIRFTVEARPGGPRGTGGWSLGARRLPDDPPTATAPFDGWPNGVPVPFVLSFDGRRTVSLTLFEGDRRAMVSYESTQIADCTELFVSAAASGAETGAVLAGLRLGEIPVKDAPAAGPPGGSGEEDVLRIQGGDLAHGFTLTGAVTLSWGSAKPSGSDLHVLFWGAKVPAAPPGQRPPSGRIAITAPAPESVLADGSPAITAAFGGSGPAIDPASVLLLVDGADRTPQAEVSASGLTFTPPTRLLEGRHTARVTVRGAGREEATEVSFVTDTVPPSIAFSSPGREVTDNATPIIRLTYSDATSGLDFKSLEVTLDGASIDSICVANLASGVCIPESPIPEGSHSLTATIRDRAGNLGTASFGFTLTLGGNGGP